MSTTVVPVAMSAPPAPVAMGRASRPVALLDRPSTRQPVYAKEHVDHRAHPVLIKVTLLAAQVFNALATIAAR
jgi:hypothetical protein